MDPKNERPAVWQPRNYWKPLVYHGGRLLHEKSDVTIFSICTVHTPFCRMFEKLCSGKALEPVTGIGPA